ncbi:hypothetical protein SLNWT_1670 [Streptomyces albus]|uniref:Tetratricopeptide repeat protein n=1 Tax=Streptomyces albus (strain ATCC 21838 / DSM 41398 / FERM P-419 / JCM 4703 / NBRC 107858) TaxID=1081613 RepID=A0A0B5ETI2_STRA4|nr:hypothetical protein SLNWT_1670 [Streptomyces albus]AOU76363.1 hypothetical protein SLNHY_1672 [Streptomyces albus]AYN32148.1 hypothetical protein DUI70_1645 [Streptomyces albus]
MSHPRPGSPAMDFGELRAAVAENDEQPEGPARNARAEQLLAEAERLGIPLAVVEALGHQLRSYNYSSEKDKMFVPFARLLRMWDERPGDFDSYEAHSLHWVFKWMSAGMLGQPHIPLASIEKWLAEMAHRYRLAGHSERAVRSCEHAVARHIGDTARAQRAYEAWLAADRDDMADCHACELHEQGSWQAHRGEDRAALALWAPVLSGEHSCAHEPHAALASSLLPLLREGRPDEARANHLRGLRLVRPMESMREAFADHVEFCALTGNEPRALELLAERPAYFTADGDPLSRMEFLAVVTRLMDRLVALGHGSQQVPGPAGRTWQAAGLAAHARAETLALAARFDARNGTGHLGARVRARMSATPLAERLPLGIRTTRPATVPRPAPVPAAETLPPAETLPTAGSLPPAETLPAAGSPSATAASLPPADSAPGAGGQRADGLGAADAPAAADRLAALLDHARAATAAQRPEAVAAWAAVARAAEAGDSALGARDRARVAEHRAWDAAAEPDEAVACLHEAATLFEEAADPGEAEACRARAAAVLARTGLLPEARATAAEARSRVLALRSRGATGAPQTAAVLAARVRVLLAGVAAEDAAGQVAPAAGEFGREAEQTSDEAFREAEQAAEELLAFAEAHADEPPLPSRLAEAHAALGELAEHRGEFTAAGTHYRAAAELFTRAEVPWFAAEYEIRLSDLLRGRGDVAGALAAAGAALEHGGGHLTASGRARVHLRLSDLLGATGGPEGTGQSAEAAAHALEAAHWADEAGESGTLGAWVRHRLGGLLLRENRHAEAAEVLEGVLTELSAETHGEGPVVQTRWWLGESLSALGEHRAAAEHWLRAAESARTWPEQDDHAALAHLAGEALSRAGLPREAARAYARASELWRGLGDTPGLVRSLRARAWLARELDAPHEARTLMATALREAETALRSAEEAGTIRTTGTTETPETAEDDAPADTTATYRTGAKQTTGTAETAGTPDTPETPEDIAPAGTGTTEVEDLRTRLAAEHADTLHQFAGLLPHLAPDAPDGDLDPEAARQAYEEALALMDRAAEAFGALGPAAREHRAAALLEAGWLAHHLGRPAAAADRARLVEREYTEEDSDSAAQHRAEAAELRLAARESGNSAPVQGT